MLKYDVAPTVDVPVEIRRVERLEAMFTEIDKLQWAAQFADPDLRLLWVSEELRRVVGTDDPQVLGYGRHLIVTHTGELWRRTLTPESALEALGADLPYYFAATPGGKEAVLEMIPEEWRPELEKLEPVEPPAVWVGSIDYVQGDLQPLRTSLMTTRVQHPDGEFLGYLRVFGPGLRAEIAALLWRGNSTLFERMARVREPRRRRAAMLFADMEGSSALSRRLPSAAYFSLIGQVFTAIDELVIERGGIVGKHAGDGVTAFFLSDELGSDSAAARAALETARAMPEVVERAIASTEGLIGADECVFKVGAHWGGALYMGQVVTGGRMEVTALGDEVHEGARVQQAARGGHVFATKHLIEQLSDADAEDLTLDPDRLVYTTVADLPDAPEKSRRDAGSVPVVEIAP
ncbi:MAG: hypothetical protein ACJ77M_18135 [Thermoleophilaceae bacterium]